MTNVINFADYATRTATPVAVVAPQPGYFYDEKATKQAVETVAKFEVGKTYTCRSICDYDCIFSYKIIARTAKRLTIEKADGSIVKRGVTIYRDAESCAPDGRYSMCPTISA